MKYLTIIVLALGFMSFYMASSKYVQNDTIYNQIAEKDSVDVWTTQWKSVFKKESGEFTSASGIYGGVYFISGDTLYQLSMGYGCYGKIKLQKLNETWEYDEDNIRKKMCFKGDELMVLFEDYIKVQDTDTNKFDVVFSYFRRKVSTKEIRKIIQKGKVEEHTGSMDEYLGIPIYKWVIKAHIDKYPLCN